MGRHYAKLNPEKALIWRIVHRDNLPWLLDNGLHCGNSQIKSPHWVNIGNKELTDKRSSHAVPLPPNGVLNDYVPFYFTPFSVMMRNINTGWGDIKQRHNDEIVILVSSLRTVAEMNLPFLFTNSHAYYAWAGYYSDLKDLDKVDWPLLQARNFRRDPDDPARFERYQAEALIYQYCPISALKGLVCHSEKVQVALEKIVKQRGLELPVYTRPGWYF